MATTIQSDGLGVSIFSCWEVAKLVENNHLILPYAVSEWLEAALAYPGVQLLNLTLPIVVESTQLTNFHRDPADQIIVATARIHGYRLLTADTKIINYFKELILANHGSLFLVGRALVLLPDKLQNSH